MIQRIFHFTGKHVYFRNPVNLISEKFHSNSSIATVCRYNLYRISPYPECSALEIHVISVILNVYQLAQHFITVFLHTRTERYHHLFEVFRFTKTIDGSSRSRRQNIPLRYRGTSP